MKKQKLTLNVPIELWEAAQQAATAWKLFYDTPDWDKKKETLNHRIAAKHIQFKVHETKTKTIVVNY